MFTYHFEITRGFGLLESLLAKFRAQKANSLIPESFRHGRIIDIGCGVYPYFLVNTQFSHRIGLDVAIFSQPFPPGQNESVSLVRYDFQSYPTLPFRDEITEVVTLLAVVEHLIPDKALLLMREVYRILKPQGLLIITTPDKLTRPILQILAYLHIVSPNEIYDHKYYYNSESLKRLITQAGFPHTTIKIGHFELGCNLWLTAQKLVTSREMNSHV